MVIDAPPQIVALLVKQNKASKTKETVDSKMTEKMAEWIAIIWQDKVTQGCCDLWYPKAYE